MASQFVQHSVVFTDLLAFFHSIREHAWHSMIHMLPCCWLLLPTTPFEVFKFGSQFLSSMK